MKGCIGAKMTGAGFGGCCIALVKNKEIENFKTKLNKKYLRKFGYALSFYDTVISDGVRCLD